MAANSLTFKGDYGSGFKSAYDSNFPPEIWAMLYQRYGKAFGMFDFLYWAGRTFNVAQREITHFEEQSIEKAVVSYGTTAQTSAGADIVLKLDSTMFDSAGNTHLRVGFDVVIPKKYLDTAISSETRNYKVTAISSDAGIAREFTLRPYQTDSNLRSTGIPAGTELMIGASSWGYGTGQPDGLTTALLTRAHKTRIYKESKGFEGGIIGTRNYEEALEGGFPTYKDRGLMELEFMLDSQLNSGILLSEENENTNMVETSQWGGSQQVVTGKGILPWMQELAQEQNYDTDYKITDFNDLRGLLESQGETSTEVLFATGSGLHQQIEDNVLGYLKEYSGGTDLLRNATDAGVKFSTFTKNTITSVFYPIVGFSNPNTFGASDYDFNDLGMVIPLSEAKVKYNSENITIPNLSLGYFNNKGEDRSRIIADKAGMNGFGYPVTSEYDGLNIFALIEAMVVFANVNRTVLVRKQ